MNLLGQFYKNAIKRTYRLMAFFYGLKTHRQTEREADMFLKVTHHDNDIQTRIECQEIISETDYENHDNIIFTVDIGRNNSESYVFNKGDCVIYVESNIGKTVEVFRWKYSEEEKKFKRM